MTPARAEVAGEGSTLTRVALKGLHNDWAEKQRVSAPRPRPHLLPTRCVRGCGWGGVRAGPLHPRCTKATHPPARRLAALATGPMGWSSPSQSGAPGSPFIHKISRREKSAVRPGAACNFERRALRSMGLRRESPRALTAEARRVQGPARPGLQFRPSNRVWRALQGHIAPASAPGRIRTSLPPTSSRIAKSHPAPREAVPGRLPGIKLRQ